MADDSPHIRQNTGVLGPATGEDAENIILNGETTAPGSMGRTEGGVPSGKPAAGYEAGAEGRTGPGDGTSPGIPSPRQPGEPDTGDSFTATSEGGTAGDPAFGSVVAPPAEGGLLTGPSGERDRRDEEALAAQSE